MNDLFIIPQETKSIIAKIEYGHVLEIGKIDIPFNSKSVVTENGLIATLGFYKSSKNKLTEDNSFSHMIYGVYERDESDESHECKELRVFDFNGKLVTKKDASNHNAIAVKKNTIYLGGKNMGGLFLIIDLENLILEQKEIDLPIKVMNEKSIDDILVIGNKLMLVDNVVFPKFLFEYDISEPNAPLHVRSIKLPNNSPNEHIIKGDINKDWLILFSSSSYKGGSSEDITISERKNGCLSLSRSWEEENENNSNIYYYKDICLIDDYLFIIRTDGLGFIDLNTKISNANFDRIPTKLTDIDRLIKTPNNKVVAINESDYEMIKLTNS